MANDNMPSMAALLGLVAVAGYQNRDKIMGFVNGLTTGSPSAQIPGGIGSALGGLVNHMQANGSGSAVNSWIGTGQNMPISSAQLSNALGPDLINKIAASTGLSADQISQQLSAVLPQVVDHLSPQGQLPVTR